MPSSVRTHYVTLIATIICYLNMIPKLLISVKIIHSYHLSYSRIQSAMFYGPV